MPRSDQQEEKMAILKTRLYVAHELDALAVHAALLLNKEFGASFVVVRGEDAAVLATDTLLFTGKGIPKDGTRLFPSAQLRRIVLPQDEERRGFIIPPFARRAAELVALKPRLVHSLGPEFTEALRQLHFLQDGTWLGPKTSEKRAKRKGGYHARQRRQLHEIESSY